VFLFDGLHEPVPCCRMGQIVDRNLCTGIGKTKCNRRTDAGIAARDERALTFKPDIQSARSGEEVTSSQ
jgi:hypothetical protein